MGLHSFYTDIVKAINSNFLCAVLLIFILLPLMESEIMSQYHSVNFIILHVAIYRLINQSQFEADAIHLSKLLSEL